MCDYFCLVCHDFLLFVNTRMLVQVYYRGMSRGGIVEVLADILHDPGWHHSV